MKLTRGETVGFFSLMMFIYAFVWMMQSHLLLKGDVSWQMHLSRIVLNGGSYVKDFFEINPPLSIYLYMPSIAIEKFFSLSAIISIRIYIYLLATLSIFICYRVITKLQIKDNAIALLLLLGLAIIFLLVPLSEFGQRENMLVIFVSPYFFLVACRLQKQPINPIFAVWIGLFAALGFAMKPFFLIPLVIIEFYYLCRLHSVQYRAWIRPETVSIFIFMVGYLLFVFLRHKDYLFVVAPIAKHFYYQSFGYSWRVLLIDTVLFFWGFAGVFYFLKKNKQSEYSYLLEVLALASVGFFIAFLVQKIDWYYHLIPAFSFGLLVYVLSFGIFVRQMVSKRLDYLFFILIAIVLFHYPYSFISSYYLQEVKRKNDVMPLINYLHKNEWHKPVYFFSANTAYMVTVLEHAGSYHASRLQFLAFMKTFLRADPITLTAAQKIDLNFFIDVLSFDIDHNKPDLIFVDTLEYPVSVGHYKQVDYLSIFASNPHFTKAWKSYHFLKTMKRKNVYQFDIYVRDNV